MVPWWWSLSLLGSWSVFFKALLLLPFWRDYEIKPIFFFLRPRRHTDAKPRSRTWRYFFSSQVFNAYFQFHFQYQLHVAPAAPAAPTLTLAATGTKRSLPDDNQEVGSSVGLGKAFFFLEKKIITLSISSLIISIYANDNWQKNMLK